MIFCGIQEIILPPSVEVLGSDCFHSDWNKGTLVRLEFEGDSMLKEIEASCFAASIIQSSSRGAAPLGDRRNVVLSERFTSEHHHRRRMLRRLFAEIGGRLVGRTAFARFVLEEVALSAGPN